ncbi:hypothetical protein [uncultured Aquimarina sp.]|uniref:hypothetical protein n=1 Tax=uncultured Aquimarina sp. TaxID=575652 RepID=UPI00260F19AA|nr:hypothetical protein [uncultured Aquimarina sp.]
MEYLNLAGVVIGSSVLTETVKYFLQYRTQKKLRKAEIRNLNAEADERVISNWIQWSDKMEQRIQELEKNNQEMKAIIIKQRERINDLEVYTEKLEHKLKIHQEKK